MDKVYLGKIVSTHGINGELKFVSEFEYIDKVLVDGFCLYIDDIIYKITSYRRHKQYILIKLNDYSDINEVLFLINKDVFINKDDLMLSDKEYLLSDLMGVEVRDNDIILGKVTSILKSNVCNYVKVNDKFLIPLIDEYIKEFKKDEKVLYTINGKNLIV